MSGSDGQGSLLAPEQLLHRAAERLADAFDGSISAETVERVVFESYTALGRTATVRTHLPSLTERFAKDRLTALAQSRGLSAKPVPEVLYICVHNAGRSQMAAALTEHLARGRVHVRSAGSQPSGTGILPAVVTALAEIGIDVTEQYPKPLTDDVVRAADAVVTMGCGDACPVYPGKRYLDWQIPDPSELDLDGVRRIRDEIRARVEALLAELVG